MRPDVKDSGGPRQGDGAEPERTRRGYDAEIKAFKRKKRDMFIVTQSAEPAIHEAAIRMARRCRHLVQACLREEEWGDADREFYLVLREELERFVAASRVAARGRPCP